MSAADETDRADRLVIAANLEKRPSGGDKALIGNAGCRRHLHTPCTCADHPRARGNRRTGPPRVVSGAGFADGGVPALSGSHSQLPDDRHDDGRERESDDGHAKDQDDEDAHLVHRAAPYAPT